MIGKRISEIKNTFGLTLTNGALFDVEAGAVRIDESGALIFYDVHWTLMSTAEIPIRWFAPGTWTEVYRK